MLDTSSHIPDFRPFLGTWIAFMHNVHLFVQLQFKVQWIEMHPDESNPHQQTALCVFHAYYAHLKKYA
jgi:hypothetical protein